MTPAAMFFALFLGHFVADYSLQSDWVAKHKSRHVNLDPPQWGWVMAAHCATHAATVWLITGSAWLGACEMLAHWFIDFAKCEGKTNIHQDQSAHLACKLVWVGAVALGAGK